MRRYLLSITLISTGSSTRRNCGAFILTIAATYVTLLSVSKKKTIKIPATKINLSQMVNLAVGTPEVGAANFNVLHTLLHAMLRQLNIVDVQANLNDFDRDFLSASKARELSVLSDADSGRVMMQKMLSARGPLPCLHQVQVLEGEHPIISSSLRSKLQTSVPSNKHLFKNPRTPYKGKPIAETWLNMLMSRVITNEKEIAKV